MRIAALGDIHGNYAALTAALHRIERENALVTLFMGDYVSDCAEPRETLDLIAEYARTHDCRFVRGNREQYMLDYRGDGSWRRGTAGGSLLYTYERLTKDDLAFFESMPRVRVERFGDCSPLLLCHGSPENLRGVPRLVYRPDQYQKVIDLNPNPANKLEFCMGSIQEMKDGNLYDAIEQYGAQKRISYVHFRNVRGKIPCYDEVFLDEGDIDMLRALSQFKRLGFDGVLIPDHTPLMTCGASWHAGMAYALGYMRAAFQMIDKGLL